MGQRTAGVVDRDREAEDESDRAPEVIEDEIEELRQDTHVLVAELDRRRHEALDVGLQVRRHAYGISAVAAVAATLVTAAVVVSAARRRRAKTMTTRVQNLVQAIQILSRTDPKRLAATIDDTRGAKESALSGLAKIATMAARPLVMRSMAAPAPRHG
jgi:negative regulator of sigma E activity